MKTSYTIKNFAAEIIATEQPRVVEGYASTFNTIDSDGDIIEKGAFKKSITERGPDSTNRIKYLFNHRPESVLGPIISLSEDESGLHYKAKISETSYGNDVYQLIRDKALTEHSIGFQTVRQKKGDNANHIQEVKLWELSTVIWGANEITPFTSVKSYGEIYDQLEQIDVSIRKGNFGKDLSLLMIKIKQLQQAVIDLTPVEETKSEESTQPEVDASKEANELLELFKENLTFLRDEN